MNRVRLSELSGYIDKQVVPSFGGTVVAVHEAKTGPGWKLQGMTVSDDAEHEVTFWNSAIPDNVGSGDYIQVESKFDSKTRKLQGVSYDIRKRDDTEYRTIKVEPGAVVLVKKGTPKPKPESDCLEKRIEQYFRTLQTVCNYVGADYSKVTSELTTEQLLNITTGQVLSFRERYGTYGPVVFQEDCKKGEVSPPVEEVEPSGLGAKVETWRDRTVGGIPLGVMDEATLRTAYKKASDPNYKPEDKDKRLIQSALLIMGAEKGWNK